MRRTMAGEAVWAERFGAELEARRKRRDSLGLRIWTLSWGLLFVVAMTLLSVLGPRLVDSQASPASVVSEPAVHMVK